MIGDSWGRRDRWPRRAVSTLRKVEPPARVEEAIQGGPVQDVPVVHWRAPVCPGCGDPGHVVSTAANGWRYHVCTDPECGMRYKSIQENFSAARLKEFRSRRRG